MEENKKKISVKKIIGYSLSLLCLILCLYITIEIIVANNNHRPPNILGISVSYVPTQSMEPTIHSGDYIMFTKANFEDVNVNDIVIYYSNDNDIFIVHRVIEKYSDYLVAKGDNNPISDTEKVLPAMVCGKYLTTVSFLNIFQGGINSNAIFFILIGIFVIMIGMQVAQYYIKSKSDKLKEEKEKKKKDAMEELRKEILEEELRKLREAKEKNEKTEVKEDNSENSN